MQKRNMPKGKGNDTKKHNFKGGRRNSGSTRRGGYTDKEVEDTKKSGNDPAWYASDPAILRDAASIPFSWPTGATNTHDIALYDNDTNEAPYSRVPGIVSLRTAPTIGYASKATDPINVASQSLYSFVRHANSGHSNYDAPDLMLYILGMASNYSYLVWCQRLYGFALTYDQRNRYISDQLIKANGVDPDSIHNNLANFRFWINTLIAKMSSFAVPATLSIFSRMSFLFSDYYIEGTSIKEQLYQYVPDGFHKFIIDTSSKGRLDYVQLRHDPSNLMTVTEVMEYGNELFGAIWDQEDFGIMSGDILKAYGDRIIKLAAIPETYQITPKFDPMVLTQMKNATILDAEPVDIAQTDNGLLISILIPENYATSGKKYFGTDVVVASSAAEVLRQNRLRMLKDWKTLTVDADEPTPDIIMEATRLMYGYDDYTAELKTGSEFVRKVIISNDIDNQIVLEQTNLVSYAYPASVGQYGKTLQVLKHFHYLPRIFMNNAYDTNHVQVEEYFDLDNFAVLDNSDIAKLHTAAVINMYAVPSIGKIQ